jgi:DNA-directed RNA polymerase subunit RPC12/RpoP
MDIEIQFLHESFPGKGPKLLVDHIRRMGSGEAPLFATTLSLVYEKLFEKTVARTISSGSGLGKSTEIQDTVVNTTSPQASTSAFSTLSWLSGTTPSSSQPPVPTPAPVARSIPSNDRLAWPVCTKCGGRASLRNLHDGVRCPTCPSRSARKGRPYMHCQSCGSVLVKSYTNCARKVCQARFR